MKSALLLLAALAAHAGPIGRKPAGYKHPDQSVGRFMEDSGPAEARKAAPAPRRDPSDVPPAPAAPTPSAADDAASEAARSDYDRKLLGAPPSSTKRSMEGAPASPAAAMASAPAAPTPAASGELFVSLELEPAESQSLRDAVAGLGAAASFRADPRFEPRPAGGNVMLVSGWLPPSRLGELITRRGVRRVAIGSPSRPAPSPEAATGDFIATLRTEPSRPRESAAEAAHALAAETGFLLSDAPSTSADGRTATVRGRLPLAKLGRALGMPAVIDLTPATPIVPLAPAPPRGDPSPAGFLRFAADRGPWLLGFTLLLLLPAFARGFGRFLKIFVPYR